MRITKKLIHLVLDFFDGDKKKTRIWFNSPNPLLGGVSPRDMILAGRIDTLMNFVLNQLSENESPKKNKTA